MMVLSKKKDGSESRLEQVFGLEASRLILKIMKQDRMEDVFGSSAEVIRQIASGEYPKVEAPL